MSDCCAAKSIGDTQLMMVWCCWRTDEEMFKQVNAVEYGLTGAIYTSNMSIAQKVVRRVEAGTLWVNTVGTHYLGMPFGGYKQSGLGREDCMEELFQKTQCKVAHVRV
jgi:betaine-aldehyde dehydrogenase